MSASKKRIYKVTMGETVHVVKASTQSQAINHVVQGSVTCEVLSAVDLVALMMAGAQVQEAGKTEPE